MLESPVTIQVVALYARVSTEEQREGQNIDSQVAELERFAASNQWPVSQTYRDEGWSGSVLARPELDRLRDDASKGVFQAVVLNDVDRLARDVTHLGIIKRDLERQGVQVIFRKLPASSSPTHNLMVNILGSFAEFERELIADRTRRGKRHKVEVRKQYVGSHPPFGYSYVLGDKRAGKDGYLEVDPIEAPIVRQMFQWVDEQGLSARRVLLRLDATNLRPKNGGRWAKSSVLRILRCETYAGVWHFGKYQSYEPKATAATPKYRKHSKSSLRKRPKAEWLPVVLPEHLKLVERDAWTRVQTRLDQNITFSPRNQKHNYLLKGLVRCGGCSSRYTGDPCHGQYYYRCAARCKQLPTILEERLNRIVWDAVVRAILNPDLIASQAERLHHEQKEDKTPGKTEQQHVEAGLKQLRNEESRLLEAYRLEVISADQLNQELEKLKPRKTALSDRQAGLATILSKPPLQVIQRSLREYCERAASRIRSITFEQRQEFLRALVRAVVVEQKSVRILGQIPLNPDPGISDTRKPKDPLDNDGRIATTRPAYCGRNEGRENLNAVATDSKVIDSRRDPTAVDFELQSDLAQITEWWLKQVRGPKGHYIKGSLAT